MIPYRDEVWFSRINSQANIRVLPISKLKVVPYVCSAEGETLEGRTCTFVYICILEYHILAVGINPWV